MGSLVLNASEQQSFFELIGLLTTPQNLEQLLSMAFGRMLEIIGADYGALAVTPENRPDAYEWVEAQLPRRFLGEYSSFAHEDFVNRAVLTQPNVVLVDEQMIGRPDLHRSFLYQRAIDCDCTIERFMAVMLHVDSGLRSGLSLYRAKDRPFSDRERGMFQLLVQPLANVVINCRNNEQHAFLEELYESQSKGIVVLVPSGREVYRNVAATRILDKWFHSSERNGTRVPDAFLKHITAQHAKSLHQRDDRLCWVREGADGELKVRFVPSAKVSGAWLIILDERPNYRELPTQIASRLSPKERLIVQLLLNGCANDTIAETLKCSTAAIKSHLFRIYDKLGACSDRNLASLIWRLIWRES